MWHSPLLCKGVCYFGLMVDKTIRQPIKLAQSCEIHTAKALDWKAHDIDGSMSFPFSTHYSTVPTLLFVFKKNDTSNFKFDVATQAVKCECISK
jgi:hypothetical protein